MAANRECCRGPLAALHGAWPACLSPSLHGAWPARPACSMCAVPGRRAATPEPGPPAGSPKLLNDVALARPCRCSLGAGAAALVSLKLRQHFPGLKCIAYSCPGAHFRAGAASADTASAGAASACRCLRDCPCRVETALQPLVQPAAGTRPEAGSPGLPGCRPALCHLQPWAACQQAHLCAACHAVPALHAAAPPAVPPLWLQVGW